MKIFKNSSLAITVSLVFAFMAFADVGPASAANPCGATNPCAANQNKAVNPCAARTGKKFDATLVTRPSGTKLAKGDQATLIREGKKLFNDESLGTNGVSCQTCHADNALFKASFAKPFPHRVAMVANKGGRKSINLDEMVQFCILVPLAGKPLPWDSRKLAALTAYTASLQKNFSPANSSSGNNPCAAR